MERILKHVQDEQPNLEVPIKVALAQTSKAKVYNIQDTNVRESI
jgi:hypothetical protein